MNHRSVRTPMRPGDGVASRGAAEAEAAHGDLPGVYRAERGCRPC